MSRTILALLACALGVLALAPAAGAQERRPKPLHLKLLAVNDLHGNLESGGTVTVGDRRIPAGGAPYLATHVDRLRAERPRSTLFVSTGDLVGASPLVSSLFDDEPTIEAMNLMGLDLNVVGNHEFDEGLDHLLRLADGGCPPEDEDACLGGEFHGADFPFLAANVTYEDTGETIFPPYVIRRVGGERIAFVGTVLAETPTIVSAQAIEGLAFGDEAEAMNALVPKLKRLGAETIVALVHQGGVQAGDGGIDDCRGLEGEIVDIVERTDDEVDVFLSGHTHQAYNCTVDGRRVVSGLSFGRLLSDLDLTIDRVTGETLRVRARNRIVTRDVEPDPEQQALLERYAALAEPIAGREIGATSAPVTREQDDSRESALGNLIADAQLAATSAPEAGGARVAFMNPGGVRADLDAGPVTFGEAFAVQPFGNALVTMTLTGGQLEQLLEQQFTGVNAPPNRPRVLLPSAGLRYAWDLDAPSGDKVDPASITLDGQPVAADATVRVTVNNFLADGGDGFTMLTEGTDRLGGPLDLAALEAFLAARSPVAPPARDRIDVVP
jgi:5'-nucleotidase